MQQEMIVKFGEGLTTDRSGRSFIKAPEIPVSANIRKAMAQQRACHLCHMKPGTAEFLFPAYGRWFHAACHARFRKFMKNLRLLARMWKFTGLSSEFRRENYKRMLATGKALAS